ncbi:MAG: hypothetical protein WB817_10905 [Terriglobales bacterium]
MTNDSMPAPRQISLPEELCAEAERKFTAQSAAQFKSLEALLEFVLRELVQDGADAEVLDREEQALLDQRLRDLGYI